MIKHWQAISYMLYTPMRQWLNEVKSRVFRPTDNFKYFEIHLYFVCRELTQH